MLRQQSPCAKFAKIYIIICQRNVSKFVSLSPLKEVLLCFIKIIHIASSTFTLKTVLNISSTIHRDIFLSLHLESHNKNIQRTFSILWDSALYEVVELTYTRTIRSLSKANGANFSCTIIIIIIMIISHGIIGVMREMRSLPNVSVCNLLQIRDLAMRGH